MEGAINWLTVALKNSPINEGKKALAKAQGIMQCTISGRWIAEVPVLALPCLSALFEKLCAAYC